VTRRFPERPIIGVGAVIIDKDRVLLVKRAHEPLKGEWSLPGGAVDVGETLHQAVAREVLEETGLEVVVGPVVDVLDRIHLSEDGRVEFHFVLIDYLCTVSGGTMAAASDAADVCWAAADDLTRYSLTDVAAAVIAKALEMGQRENASGLSSGPR
jgi:8-oxo-dGTP diphosphatase